MQKTDSLSRATFTLIVSRMRLNSRGFVENLIRKLYHNVQRPLTQRVQEKTTTSFSSSRSLARIRLNGLICFQALQNWLEGADKGVIYFNLGCNFKSTSLAEDARNNILKYFKELPQGYRVLWKWEADGPMPGLGDNILTQKWFPQQSILGQLHSGNQIVCN